MVKFDTSRTQRVVAILVYILAAGMLLSGIQHLLGSPDLREHYKAVALPGVTSLTIGLLQSFVGIALFWPKTRRSACAGLATVMALILAEHAVRGQGGQGAVEVFIIGVAALFGLAFTRPLHRRNGRQTPILPGPHNQDRIKPTPPLD